MYVHTASRSLILKVRDPLAVRELMPDHSRLIRLPDGHNVQVRWSLDSAKLLRNIGVAAPSPVRSFYSWPGMHKPLDHQVDMADFQTLHDKCFNLSEPGTGKTYATLWAADYLMEVGAIQRALVVCPLSSTKLTWANDIFKILPHRTCAIVHGPVDRRMKNLARPYDFYILNHDGIDIEAVAKVLRKRPDIGLVVIDEADVLCNAQTDVYRFLKWIMERKQRLWLLTGTPTPNAPTDAWALSKLVSPELSPTFFGRFRDETMYKATEHRWLPKVGSRDRAFEILQPAIRIKKRECISLPPLIGPRDVQTSLSKEQIAALKSMRDEMTMFARTAQITAVNGADKITKLRQILAGVVKDPTTGEYHLLDCRERVRDLRRLISRSSAKVLVIAPFTGIVRHLSAELPKDDKSAGLHGVSVLTMNGDISPAKRPGIIGRFKEDPDVKAMICHPQVMSHGLNLSEADTTVFYAPIYSNRQYSQVIERFNRMGQRNTMYLLRMLAHPIEAAIYKVVDDRGTMQMGILDLYKAFISGKDDIL